MMYAWMTLWTLLLVASIVSFLGLLLAVGAGVIGELKQSLAELREDTRQSTEHPEILDEAT